MDETLQKKIEKENLLFPPCLVGGIEEDSYSLRRDSKSPSESVLFYFMPLWKEKKSFSRHDVKKNPCFDQTVVSAPAAPPAFCCQDEFSNGHGKLSELCVRAARGVGQ